MKMYFDKPQYKDVEYYMTDESNHIERYVIFLFRWEIYSDQLTRSTYMHNQIMGK